MTTSKTAETKPKVQQSTVPKIMNAAAMNQFGAPDVLSAHEIPVPKVGPSEILIELFAAGVGIWDARMRDGSWWSSGKPKFPVVLGTDGAGIVAAKGARVRRFEIGDRVWAYEYANSKSGFYSEYVAVNAQNAGSIPETLDLPHAGAAAVTGLTALQGIDDHLRVKDRDTVLIFGASGAVGSLAIQFAKRKSATVVGMARGRDAIALVKDLGADEAIDSGSENALEQLKSIAPDGIDAVLALAGGDKLEQCLDLVCPQGRVAYPNGVEPEPPHRKTLRVQGYDAEANPQKFARLAEAVEEADLQVPIAEVFPLEEAAEAHKRLERGHVLGRIVLRIRA